MNNQRRAALTKILGEIEEMKSKLETIRDEEREVFDAMPESLQLSDRGQASDNALNEMDSAISALEDAIGAIENSKE